MRSDVRLEALMFQLTTARTRCELVLALDGEREKIGSGMLEPFMAHLKTVNDLVIKGGYSVVLQPPPEDDDGALWFTKATVQRFVRFVSTPDILERLINIVYEIERMDEAIAIHENQPILEQSRSSEFIEGSRYAKSYGIAERASIIYKPKDQQSESSGSTLENSRAQRLRKLENRKFALQKEQEMAFARASVSGFELDHMTDLISFAKCFGGPRLLTACVKYMDLCRVKHDTSEWLEIEPTEEMSIQMKSDLSSMNGADMFSPGDNPHMPPGHFQHPMFPQWPMQPPPGGAGFQPYPMQGPPYYQNYPGSGPYFQPPPYSAMVGDPRFNSQKSSSSTKSQDEMDQEEVSEDQGSRRKASGSSKKKRSGTVVIRNINLIESKRCNAYGRESESDSLSENEKESKGLHEDTSERRKKKSSYDGGKESVSEKWQAFQNFLLRDEDDSGKSADHGMFSGEKAPPHLRRRKKKNIDLDEILPAGQDSGDFLAWRLMNFDKDSCRRLGRKNTADNDLSYSNEGRMSRESRLDEKFQEMELGGQRYRQGGRVSSDDFMIYGQDRRQSAAMSSVHSHSENEYKLFSGNLNRDSLLPNITDESFIVCSTQVPQGERDIRTIIDNDTEFRPTLTEDSRINNRNLVNSEPADLRLIWKNTADNDLSYSNEGRMSRESRLDEKFQEMELGGQWYRQGGRVSSDDFMIYGQDRRQSAAMSSVHSHSENAYKCFSGNLNRASQLPNITDESFIVCGTQVPQGERDSQTIIDFDNEFRPTLTEDSRINNRNRVNYEPENLSLMWKNTADNDLSYSNEGRMSRESRLDEKFEEMAIRGPWYRQGCRASSDDFLICGQDWRQSADESLIVCGTQVPQGERDSRTIIDIDTEFRPTLTEDSCINNRNRVNYEPDNLSHIWKNIADNDLSYSDEGRMSRESRLDGKFQEMTVGGQRYRQGCRASSDDFLICGQDWRQSADESLIVCGTQVPQGERDSRTIIDIDTEFRPTLTEDSCINNRNRVNYEPDNLSHIRKNIADNDLSYSNEGRMSRECMDKIFQEMELGGQQYRQGGRASSDDFMIYGQDRRQSATMSAMHSHSENEYNLFSGSLNQDSQLLNITDESFILCDTQVPQGERDSRTIINFDTEFRPILTEDSCINNRNQIHYEPNDISLKRKNTADKDLSYSNEGRMPRESRLDEKFHEMELGGQRYRQGGRVSSDDFMIYGQDRRQSAAMNSVHSHSENEYKLFSGNLNRDSLLPNIIDESFIVCSTQVPQGERDIRTIIDIDTEFRPTLTEDSRINNRNLVNYEPDGLSLIPTREVEGDSLGFDPAAIENDLVARVPGNVLLDNAMKYHIATSAKQGPKKTEKEKKTRNLRDGLNRRKIEPLIWGILTQSNPRAEVLARADKLRAYKADLHKEMKLMEEQEVKRLEALKRERQKQITARGGSFTASVGSNDSQKITKTSSRLYGSSRSVPSLPDMKKEENSITSEKKSVSRLSRLSNPRGCCVHHVSSVKSASSDQVVSKQKISETKMKKISAIINQDKSKSATLPGLKVRKSTGTERVSSAKKGNGDKITVVSEKLKIKPTVQNRQQHRSNEDDTPIIEKTVVTEGQKRLSVPILASSESYNGHSTDVVSEYAQIHVPSTINTNELEKVADEIPSDKQPTHEAMIDCVKDDSQVMPYEAPHARVSSIKDSSTITVSHSEAPPQVKISEIIKSDCEVVPQTHLSGSCQSISLEPETTENTHVKGFKKLLKFGIKSRSSPRDASKSSSVAPFEGTTLKCQISEDDSHTGSNSKGTRSFNILTPFRDKSSEKRTAF